MPHKWVKSNSVIGMGLKWIFGFYYIDAQGIFLLVFRGNNTSVNPPVPWWENRAHCDYLLTYKYVVITSKLSFYDMYSQYLIEINITENFVLKYFWAILFDFMPGKAIIMCWMDLSVKLLQYSKPKTEHTNHHLQMHETQIWQRDLVWTSGQRT